MPGRDRIARRGDVSFHEVQIRAAYAASAHPNARLSRTGFGERLFLPHERPGFDGRRGEETIGLHTEIVSPNSVSFRRSRVNPRMSLPLAQQALQEAQRALQRGEKRAARRWAERALAQDAGLEEAWLVLAAVSTPRASLEYLQRALQINPQSERRGAAWNGRVSGWKPSPRPCRFLRRPPHEPPRGWRHSLRMARAFAGPFAVGMFLLLALFLALPLARSLTPQNASTPPEAAPMAFAPGQPASPTPPRRRRFRPCFASFLRWKIPPRARRNAHPRTLADPLPTDTPEPALAAAPAPGFPERQTYPGGYFRTAHVCLRGWSADL